MNIHFSCGNCGSKYIVDSSHSGKKATCKKCSSLLIVPENCKSNDFDQIHESIIMNKISKYLIFGTPVLLLLITIICYVKISALTGRLDEDVYLRTVMNLKIQELVKSVNGFEYLKTLNDIEQIAYLTPGQDGYSTIKFNLGIITVKIENILPYANGSKVTLQFGNTLSAKINGLKASLEWGNVDKDGVPILDPKKQKEIVFDNDLKSGSWTEVSVVLEGVPPSDFGFLRITNLSHTGISLIRPD